MSVTKFLSIIAVMKSMNVTNLLMPVNMLKLKVTLTSSCFIGAYKEKGKVSGNCLIQLRVLSV